MTFWKAKGGWGNKRQGFLVFIKIDVCAFKLSNHKGLEQVSAVPVILLFLSLEDLMENFSHSWDSTHWATEYPCSCGVLGLEGALVRTRPPLAVVVPVTEFKCCAPNNQHFSWVLLMQVISVSCADFQSVSEDYLFNSSYLCFVQWNVIIFQGLLRCLVPASCHSWFVSIWALWLDVLGQELLSPFALLTCELAVSLIFFSLPFCISGMIPEEGGK